MVKWAIARRGLASYWTGGEFDSNTDLARLYDSLPAAIAVAGNVPFGLKYVPVGDAVRVPA